MPLDYPNQDYYPSWKLRLTIRFDEFGQTTRLKPAPPKPAKNLKGTKVARAPLAMVGDPLNPNKLLLVIPGQTKAEVSTQQARSSDGLTFDVTTIPKDMAWNVNGIRTADTLNATLKFIDCPIDPRTVRSCAVEGFIGTVKASDFQDGVEGLARVDAQTGQSFPFTLIPDTYIDSQGRDRTNSRFQGFVDKWDVTWNDDEPEIKLECRDLTQLFIEQECPPNIGIDQTKALDVAIATYLTNFPQFQGLSIEYRPDDVKVPILKDVLCNTAFRPNLGIQPAKGGGSEKHSVWDYLTDVCGSIGHSVRMVGTTLVVQSVRSLTTSSAARRSDDPFTGRTLPSGQHLEYRQFIYGINLSEMKVTRHYAKKSPTNVELRSFNTEGKQLLVARFPEAPDRLKWAIPGEAQPDQKWTVLRVSGIKDATVLKTVAQTVYESLGRNELQVDCKTHNLASYGGGNEDPDILDMQAGDTFELLVNRASDDSNTLNAIEAQQTSFAKNAEFMKRLGFATDFANAYAKAYTDAGFLTQFRLKQMQVHCAIEDGVDVSVTGVNYIEVRSDKQNSDEPEKDYNRPTLETVNQNQ